MNTRILAGLACLLLVVAIVCAPVLAQSRKDPQAQVDTLFSSRYDAQGAGLAMGVYRNGALAYAQGYGLADLEHGAPITPTTQFAVASLSKQFTAYSILLLERDGKLDLDDDVRRHLPWVPDFGQVITLRQLIHHTSGLRDQWSLFWLAGKDGSRQSEVISLLSRQRALNFAPGSEHVYNNSGYTLLAEVVKQVSGMSLRSFTQQRIFAPLGMARTFFHDDLNEIVPGRANSYCRDLSYCKDDRGTWFLDPNASEIVGATNLMSTVEDQVRWIGYLARPGDKDRALIDRYLAMGALDDGTPINYGFGLLKGKADGRNVILHTGQDAGFNTVMMLFPDDDFGVSVLANHYTNTIADAEAVARIFLADAPRRTQPGDGGKAVVPRRASSRDAAALAALEGIYQGPGSAMLMFERMPSGGIGLKKRVDGTPSAITLRQDGSVDLGDEARAAGGYYRLQRDAAGRVVSIRDGIAGDNGRAFEYRRVASTAMAPGGWQELLGDYRSPELDITYTVSLDNGVARLTSMWSLSPITLKPAYADVLQGARYFDHLRVERDAQGRVAALLVSNFVDRDIRFERVK
ncbi:serine hydrolase domain-containing protein [Luteimonas sp. RIT-PG2_3]